MNVVEQLIALKQAETVRLDSEKLANLYRQLGEAEAENVVCRAVEELAVRLTHCERLWRQAKLRDLRKSARSLIAISDQIGLVAMARVAGDVTECVDNEDSAAIAATLFRLIRIGEGSLTAVWDQRDLSL
ncbi:hypothetical protein [Primorskyibacter sp. S87]|uniref:hypothetical protein n=1 Tax=Primorskyibacter sp. S87 TaxID=3415126 RepID=UPI003C7B9825